jgi:hypothetical protein
LGVSTHHPATAEAATAAATKVGVNAALLLVFARGLSLAPAGVGFFFWEGDGWFVGSVGLTTASLAIATGKSK